MIFNTGLGQTPAVRIYTVYILRAGVWPNPVKYFTDKKSRALAKISQNPASNALQVLELIYRAGFKLGGHIFEKGIFSVLYKHKLPRIFIGFSKVLKYVNF